MLYENIDFQKATWWKLFKMTIFCSETVIVFLLSLRHPP